MKTTTQNTMTTRRTSKIAAIAKEWFSRDSLETAKNGSDFQETAVWSIKAALEAAYDAGRDATNQRLLSAAKAALALWNKHGLGDDDAESEPVYNALAKAIRDAERSTNAASEQVHPGDACKACGERESQNLIWADDGSLVCSTCGHRDER